MRQSSLEPVFVGTIPELLEEGRLYISIRFRTASHLCVCGCGDTVVTPIKPAKWRLTYDGDTVSLFPSIGRWQSSCGSHYLITRNAVVWARDFSPEEREAVRQRDAAALREYYSPGGREPQPALPGRQKRTWHLWRPRFLRRR